MKKTITHKLLSVLLAVGMIVNIIIIPQVQAATEYSSSDFKYTVSNGEATIIDYIGAGKTEITIPNTLGGYPVTTIESNVFWGHHFITGITIGNNIRTIKSGAFEWCTKLQYVNLGSSVKEIDYAAFRNCDVLSSIYIPNSVTSIGAQAFSGCEILNSISIGSGVKTIADDAFSTNPNLTTITVSSSNTNYASMNGVLFNKNVTKLICFPSGKSGSYTVPSSIESIGSKAFSECDKISTIIFSESLTNIENNAFYGCDSLQTVMFNNSLQNIGEYSFYNCKKLNSISLPDSLNEIGQNAFGMCTNLKSINWGNGIKTIAEYMFSGCTSLQEVSISNSIESISSYAFSGCSSLSTIGIGTNVKIIENNAFRNTGITSINIPESVDKLGVRVFSNCTNLEEATLGAKTIDNFIFYNCPKLKSINLLESVQTIGTAIAYRCPLLTSLHIPSKISSINSIVYDSENFKNVTISGDNPFFRDIDGVVYDKSGTKLVYYPCGRDDIYNILNGTQTIGEYAFESAELNDVKIPNTVNSLEIGAFNRNDYLKYIKLPNSVTYLGEYSLDTNTDTKIVIPPSVTEIKQYTDVFGDVSNVTAGTIYGIPGSYAEQYSIANDITFVETTQIATPKIQYYTENNKVYIQLSCDDSNANIYYTTDGSLPYAGSTKYTEPFAITENTTIKAVAEQDYHVDSEIAEMVYDFDNIRYLTFDSNTGTITACSTDARNITIPEYIDGVKVVAIGDRAFENCTNLYSVNLPESITSIGQECFKGCESLQSITLPDSVTSIGTGIFTDCSSLGNATLSNNLTFIPNRTFKNCQSLNNVKINSSIESIGLEAFMDCQGLTNLTIPRSVNSIGNYAFSGCNSLRIINIPTGVTSIGVNTFKDCSALTKATIPAEVTSIASGAFSNCPKLVIYGYKNSTAQSYASDNNIQFSLIPDAVSSINETFEKNELPAGWISSNSSGAYWSVGSTQDGDYHAMFNSYSSPSGSKGRLVSPSIKVAGGQTVFVSCYMRHDLGYSTRKDRLHLEYSVDNGDTWTQLTDDKVRYNGNEEWEKISAEIPNLENGTVCIGFVGISDYGNYIYVDNITVSPVDNTAEVESVSFDVSDITMNIGDERTIKSSVLPENARDRSLTWASSDESVAVVTDGHIKAIKDGTAVITATSSNGKKAQCSVTVTKVKSLPEVETKDTSNITTNSANISGAITNDGNSSITSKQFIYYEKNSPDSKYTIEADSNFSASLTNLKPSTEYWYQAQAENEIGVANGEIKTFTTKDEEVIIEPDSIQITPTYLSLQPNDERTLAVTVLPANAQNRNVVWESEDTSVVTIDNNGNIKAVGEGKTKVKATTVVNRLSAYCEIEVKTKEVSGNFDFSEHNMITNSSNLNEKSGFDYGPDDGGNSTMATAYLSRWNGAVLEENDQYPSPARPENIKYNEVDSDYHVQNVIYLPDRKNALDNDDIKKAIMNYGAVHAAFLVNWDCFDNSETNYYLPEGMSNNGGHAIAIVGWDDNYSKDNFVNTPPGNGAFICKNSWGTYSGEDGYFYISYYDSQIGIRGINTVFNNIENKTNYNKIYQYDPLGAVGTYGFGNKIYGANVFPSEDSKLTNDEILKAVSFYTNDKGTEYEIYIVPNYQSVNSLKKLGTSVASGVMEYAGYHTVNLPEDITIKAGTRFAVVVKLSNKSGANMSVELPYDGYSSNARGNHGESFLSSNGTGWTDINDMSDVDNANVCIKAFTSTAQNRITLMSAIDNETREYESNSVYNIDEVINSGFEINPELVSYLNNNSKGDISLFSDNSNNSMGQIPDAIIIGNTDINFAEGIAFPERYDLRDSNSVSPVKNQGGIGSCWSFATYASLESCLLKKADNTDSGIINLDNIINNSTAKVAVDSINIVDNCKMAVGTEKVIQAEILPLSAAKGVKWSSSDENIVTVDTSGHIYAKSIGTAIITVECGGKSASCSVMVTNGTNVESISLNEKSRNADVGDKFILNYSIAPEDALNKKVVWRSSNPDIANVDEYGVVTILQNGKVTITATTTDGEKTDVCVLNDDGSSDITPTPIPEPCFTIENNGTAADVTNTGKEQMVTVIIAQYDGGVLQNVKAEEITFSENEKRTFALGEGTYKVFVWNSLSDMIPMTK